MSTEIEALPESKLGTKQHWDDVYEREVDTFKELGEEGEVWFGESSAKKMVSWTRTHLPPTSSTPPTVLDLGCGNGHFLFLLSSKTNGYPGKLLTGVDYSQGSVDLAQMIGQAKASGEGKEDSDESESEDEDEGAEDRVGTEGEVQFEQADVLLGEELKGGPWDLVTDKGTYDALCLSSQPLPPSNLPPSELYPQRVTRLIKPGGFFLITSCNFTESEIISRFTQSGLGLTYHSRVNHPTFTFGGAKGSTVCTVAFQKTA